MCPPPPPPPPPTEEGSSSPTRSPSPPVQEVVEEPTVKPSEVVQREDTGGWDPFQCYASPILVWYGFRTRTCACIFSSVRSRGFTMDWNPATHKVAPYIISSTCHLFIYLCVLFIYLYTYLYIDLFIDLFSYLLIYLFNIFKPKSSWRNLIFI
jgi:hypothetical protein